MDALRRARPLDELSPGDLGRLLTRKERITLSTGQVLFREGDKPLACYLLIKGSLQLEQDHSVRNISPGRPLAFEEVAEGRTHTSHRDGPRALRAPALRSADRPPAPQPLVHPPRVRHRGHDHTGRDRALREPAPEPAARRPARAPGQTDRQLLWRGGDDPRAARCEAPGADLPPGVEQSVSRERHTGRHAGPLPSPRLHLPRQPLGRGAEDRDRRQDRVSDPGRDHPSVRGRHARADGSDRVRAGEAVDRIQPSAPSPRPGRTAALRLGKAAA